MSALIRLTNRALAQRGIAVINRLQLLRKINTSQKKDETASVAAPRTKEDFACPSPDNWISWGFDTRSKANDREITHWTLFTSITLCLVVGTFVWSYLPDTQLRDWAQREAYLELRRRESAGLEPISPHYIDPQRINLPSDEELGDTDIII